jgi:Mn-containing catalase
VKETLTFLMTREIAHQKMFEAALAALPDNFPPGNLPGDPRFTHTYFQTHDGKPTSEGFELVNGTIDYGFEKEQPGAYAELPAEPQPHPSMKSQLSNS